MAFGMQPSCGTFSLVVQRSSTAVYGQRNDGRIARASCSNVSVFGCDVSLLGADFAMLWLCHLRVLDGAPLTPAQDDFHGRRTATTSGDRRR